MAIYESEAGKLRLALCGDAMITRRLRPYREEPFLQLRSLLTSADCAFANLETLIHEYDEGMPGLNEGTFMTTEPRLLEDMKWLGINLVSCANSHTMDFGEEGLLANMRHLDAADIAHAGSGRNLTEAASPGYLDTPAGRVALISAVSTFKDWHRARDGRAVWSGRPGSNALGSQTIYQIDEESLDDLRRIGRGIGLDAEHVRRSKWFFSKGELGGGEGGYTFMGKRFEAGPEFAVRTKVNQRDLETQLRQIREAKRQADWVIVSLHSHENGGKSLLTAEEKEQLEEPADFVKDFAHACIDEGAHVFVGHGPHSLLGAEIYKDRPIFYSLGDFIMQNETVRFFPSYAYERFGLGPDATPADFLDTRTDNNTKAHPADPACWESVVAVCNFERGHLAGVELHPVDVGYGRPRPQRGRPVLADRELGERIISRLAHLSSLVGGRVEQGPEFGTLTRA